PDHDTRRGRGTSGYPSFIREDLRRQRLRLLEAKTKNANGRKAQPTARAPAAAKSMLFSAVIIHRARPPPRTSAVTTASTATIAKHTVSLRSFQGTGRARSMESAVERALSSKAQRSSRPTVAITPAVSRARARAWAVI